MALPGFTFTTFPATAHTDDVPNARTAAWNQATATAFHDTALTDEQLRTFADRQTQDRRTLTSAFEETNPEGLDGRSIPVATYGVFPKQLNLGRGRLVDAHLITGVSVRPTHRRRGLFRELITTDLADAASRGVAIGLLTASEASIYRRFGFGKASFTRVVRVDTGPRFGLHAVPGGRVEVVDPTWLAAHTASVFEAFHRRTAGSLERTARYADSVLGAEPGATKPAASTRAAVHLDAVSGDVDGYVTFRVVGATLPGEVNRLEVIDLVAASSDAYLALWEHLAAVDLIAQVRWDSAPIDDPLVWALRDSRCLTVEAVNDHLWVRVLNPVEAFEARPYTADGSAIVRVNDALGYASGVFRIEASGGSATVTRLDEATTAGDATAAAPAGAAAADLELDVSTLGSLLLGTVRPSVLARAGDATITGGATAAERLDALFAPVETPYCISHF